MSGMLAIEARNVTKSFSTGVVAVSGLDLAVTPGSVFGLIGRNGAGKTTTLRLLMGLLRPDSGTTRLLGYDLWQAPRQARQRVAYVSQSQQLPGWMTWTDFLRYHAGFFERWDGEFARRLAARWDLPANRALARMSGGEQRLVAVALALAARPEVLLLDEPAAGLDPIARRGLLSGIVEALGQTDGCTVLLCTHLITDVQRVADTVGILDRGRLVAQARLADLLEQTQRVQVIFEQAAPPPGFAIPGALRSQTTGPVVTALVRLAHPGQLDPVRRMTGVRLNLFPVNLEELFIELLGRRQDAREGEGTDPADSELFALESLGG